jgi:hypothetical protein
MDLTVRDQSSTGAATGPDLILRGIDDRITLRDLIRTRVREEVALFNAAPGTVFRGLVMPVGAEPGSSGFELSTPRRVQWELQAAEALDAFGRNGFFVLVDDQQVVDLDQELKLTADSDIRFVRLVQLVGG